MKTSLLLTLPALLILAGTAHAQISWGGVQADTGHSSDINTDGTFFDAINTIYNGTFTTTTVGDTTFNALSLDSDTSDGTMSDVIVPGDGNFHGVGAPDLTDTTDDSNFGYAINNSSDAKLGTVTIGSTTNALTIGDVYQVQVWSYWANTNYGATLNGDPSVNFPNGGGGFSIGTFTADATTETFTYTGNPQSYGAGFVSEIAVRDLGAAPEPSTYAMILTGLAALGFCFRRKLA